MDNELIPLQRNPKEPLQRYQTIPDLEVPNQRHTFDVAVESPQSPPVRQWKYSFEAAEIEARYRAYNETGRWQRPCVLIVAIVFTSLFISLPFLFNIFAQGPIGKLRHGWIRPPQSVHLHLHNGPPRDLRACAGGPVHPPFLLICVPTLNGPPPRPPTYTSILHPSKVPHSTQPQPVSQSGRRAPVLELTPPGASPALATTPAGQAGGKAQGLAKASAGPVTCQATVDRCCRPASTDAPLPLHCPRERCRSGGG
eukprot:5384000-Pyramimonas_sp.AAC.1